MVVGGQHAPYSKAPVPIVHETGWALGRVWTGVENLAPARVKTLNCQPIPS